LRRYSSTLIETIAMKDKEQLSTLISGIYDAALEPAQRSDVLDRIARFTGGHSSGLLVKHSLTNSDSLYCYLGDDPESLQAYSEEYPELEPAASSNPFDAQQVVTTTDLVPYDEFRRGRSRVGEAAGMGGRCQRGNRKVGHDLRVAQRRPARGERHG
jgi:hypothetical protein